MESYANWYISRVTVAPSPANSGTTLTVLNDPTAAPYSLQTPFTLAIWPGNVARPNYSNAEIITVGTAAGTALSSITRAIEGSTARTIVVGDQIAQLVTAKMLLQSTAGFYFEYDLAFSTPHILSGLGASFSRSIPFTSAANPLGNEFDYTNHGRMTFPAGVIATFNDLVIQTIDTRYDAFDYAFNILVTDDTGTNQLVIGYSTFINNGLIADGDTKVASDLSVLTSVGTDLSYNSATGAISSAAGGLYEISTYSRTSWD